MILQIPAGFHLLWKCVLSPVHSILSILCGILKTKNGHQPFVIKSELVETGIFYCIQTYIYIYCTSGLAVILASSFYLTGFLRCMLQIIPLGYREENEMLHWQKWKLFQTIEFS